MSGCAGSEGGNGRYYLANLANGSVATEITEANADFGSQNSQNFCYDPINSLEVIDLNGLIRLYPNPGKDILHIDANGMEINQVKVFNAMGSVVDILNGQGQAMTISTSKYASSVYLIEVVTSKGTAIQRWVKN